jgi:hypothetical protein
MITNLHNSQGTWTVGQTKFTNKIQALLEATRTKLPVQYHFYHDVWQNFDKNLLGKIGLKELYKQRAQMLRDKYDYLVLYYSGGSDSWTILNTFLENNIRLDCVYVRWPMKAENTYTPNTDNRSAYNFMSEWDFVIKKDLEWLSQSHPEIKIELADFMEGVGADTFNDDTFAVQNHHVAAAQLLRQSKFSQFEIDLVDQGKRVGEIWGIDKPIISEYAENQVGMFFKDEIVTVGRGYPGNPDGPEFFYWSPEFPLLAMEQAYQCFLFYKANPPFRSMISQSNWKKMYSNTLFYEQKAFFGEYVNHFTKQVVYPDWDFSKFQAGKPTSVTRQDKDFWLYTSPELKPLVDRWRHYHTSQLSNIDSGLLSVAPQGGKLATRICSSPIYHIGTYDNV